MGVELLLVVVALLRRHEVESFCKLAEGRRVREGRASGSRSWVEAIVRQDETDLDGWSRRQIVQARQQRVQGESREARRRTGTSNAL